MKLQRILETLHQEPLVLTPSAHASLVKLFDEHRGAEWVKREGVDWCGKDAEIDQAEMVDGIMHIPVNGPIGRGLGKFEKGAGAVDVSDLEDEISKAEDDSNCRAIVFHFDTPGGMYNGTPELADIIANCSKTTAAFVPGMCCSGGYYLAASCSYIFATKSADIGNVGVYCYLLDQSERYKSAGLKPEVISSGEYKGMGAPGIPLTDAQRGHLQDRVNAMARTFQDHVTTARPDVRVEDLRGQCFKAPDALRLGFIDDIVSSIEDVVALL